MTRATMLLSLLLLAGHGASAETLPNIIFLMSDDQSTYSMGCFGNSDVQTPHLDQLASDGIAFDRHYATTAICMASRATVMTGMYEYKTGCNFSHGDMLLPTWRMSYPVLLRKAGYLTAFAGKFGFDVRAAPGGERLALPAADFDRWGGSPGQTSYETKKNESMAAYAAAYPHSTLSYGAFACDVIRDAVQVGKPFTLSISFKAPHRPVTPDPQFAGIYAGKTFQKPANFGREHGEHFSKQSRQDRQYERFYAWNYADRYDEVMAAYHQQVYAIDVAVGMIRNVLVEQGAAGNTVILYTSDNGFFCGSHGYGSKVLPYEEASRVPMIIFDPRHSNSGKQLRSDALTGHIDIAPTILRLAGLPIPEAMDGADLMQLYQHPTDSIHEALSLVNVWGHKATHTLAVVTKDMKYIHWGYAGEGFDVTEELYHLGKDPLELVNQAGNPEYGQALQHMRRAYDERLAHWAAEAVPYHHYRAYGTMFDRTAAWAEKAALLGRP